MTEHIIVSLKANAQIEPIMSIWGWQITSYLFLNAVAAGAMLLASVVIVSRREESAPFTAYRLPLIGLIAIMLAVTALSLDLERMYMAWRFYTTIQMTSSMSRGSWALMVVIPMLALLTAAQLRQGYPPLAALLERIPLLGPLLGWIFDLTHRFRWLLAAVCLLLAIDLGLHTGVLLSSLNARPFWASPLLAPILLAAAGVAGGAVVILAATQPSERRLFARVTLGFIVAELILIALFVELMHSGAAIQQQAIAHVLGGDHTALFWGGVVGLGLVLPLLLTILVSWRPVVPIAVLSAVLLLGGVILFSQTTLDLGQKTRWIHVENQFNPDLLKLLTSRTGTSHAE